MSMKLMDILLERVDFQHIATELVKKAGLKSKVKFINTGKNKADYNVDDDTIRIKPTSRLKDFLVTVFHEIDHAKDAQRMGKEKYKKAYEMEMNKAVQRGGDAHDDNYDNDGNRDDNDDNNHNDNISTREQLNLLYGINSKIINND